MLITACAMAMLFKHTPLPVARGLQGPENSTVNTMVEATSATATRYIQILNPKSGLIRWYRTRMASLVSVGGQMYVSARKSKSWDIVGS